MSPSPRAAHDGASPRWGKTARLWVAPLAVFGLLLALTAWTWDLQVQSQRDLLRSHTADTCAQIARRLQVLLSSRMSEAAIFAGRWSASDADDPTPEQFSALARTFIEELPGVLSLQVVSAQDASILLRHPQEPAPRWKALGVRQRADVLIAAARRGKAAISAPAHSAGGEPLVFAALPIPQARATFLVVELQTRALLGEGFEHRIRAEFNLRVRDRRIILYTFYPDQSDAFARAPLRSRTDFKVGGRTWTVELVPLPALLARAGGRASYAVLFLGGSLSVGLGLLVFLLARRMDLYRRARDRALEEIARREHAQQALSASEARYRSVFDSATDGLLVLDLDGAIREANPTACLMHGYPAGSLVGRSIKELFAPSHQHLYDELWRQLKSFRTARLDAVNVTSEGQPLDVEVRGTSLSYNNKARALAILTDVSERRQAVQRQSHLSRKVLVAQEEERARLARELHDELGQVLTAIHLELSWLSKRLHPMGAQETAGLDSILKMVEGAADDLRHICRGLRPQVLDDLGMEPAVRLLVEEFKERTRIPVTLSVHLEESEARISAEVALASYRILQEALHNVGRHADAKEVSVSVTAMPAELLISVYDDGKGFTVDSVDSSRGCGIAGMRERASLVNGVIDIRSEAFQGTRVALRVPLPRPTDEAPHDQDPHR